MRRQTIDIATGVIGAASLLSGAIALVAPRVMADLYGMPRRPMRALGARDIAIGVFLLARRCTRPALFARGLSDAADVVLIAREATHGEHAVTLTIGRISTGALLAAFSLVASALTHRRLGTTPVAAIG